MKKTIILALFVQLMTVVNAQTVVKGNVVNERGEAVEYVSIGFDEDSVGVISDVKGHFTLTIPAGRNNDLSFTHVSYQDAIVPYATYSKGNNLKVVLKPIYKHISPTDNGKKFSVSPDEHIVLKGKKKYCISVNVVDYKGNGGIFFPANFKSSYARNAVKGKMKKLPACPPIIVKGYKLEN